jgi:N-acetylglucosamine kinase-like BadF-type ATPase
VRRALSAPTAGDRGYVLGVDAGNSKTVALIVCLGDNERGEVVGWGRSGPGDLYVSERAACEAVAEAVSAALARARLTVCDLQAACLSLVGADWPEDFSFWYTEAAQRGYGGPARRVVVVNDALGALRAGAGEGVAVVCGTGAAVGARKGGRVWHTSFWQEPLGGHALSERTLRALYQAELGLGPPTALTERVLAHTGVEDVETLLHRLTARTPDSSTRARCAELSRVLLDVAGAGDAVALKLVREAGAALGDYALAAARRVGLAGKPFDLVLSGGVLRHPTPVLRAAIVERVRSAAPGVRPLQPALEPVVGACVWALELAGGALERAVWARFAATSPPASFFTT